MTTGRERIATTEDSSPAAERGVGTGADHAERRAWPRINRGMPRAVTAHADQRIDLIENVRWPGFVILFEVSR